MRLLALSKSTIKTNLCMQAETTEDVTELLFKWRLTTEAVIYRTKDRIISALRTSVRMVTVNSRQASFQTLKSSKESESARRARIYSSMLPKTPT